MLEGTTTAGHIWHNKPGDICLHRASIIANKPQ